MTKLETIIELLSPECGGIYNSDHTAYGVGNDVFMLSIVENFEGGIVINATYHRKMTDETMQKYALYLAQRNATQRQVCFAVDEDGTLSKSYWFSKKENEKNIAYSIMKFIKDLFYLIPKEETT